MGGGKGRNWALKKNSWTRHPIGFRHWKKYHEEWYLIVRSQNIGHETRYIQD